VWGGQGPYKDCRATDDDDDDDRCLGVAVEQMLNICGDYVEKWCAPKSCYVSYLHLCKDKVLYKGVLVALFFMPS
jgi:hypothetical protein